MSIKEFLETVARYFAKILATRFTGQIVITINARQGGIGNVQVSTHHELTKDAD